MKSAFKEGGNTDVTARVIPDVNHLFLQDADGFPATMRSSATAGDANRHGGDYRRLARAETSVSRESRSTKGPSDESVTNEKGRVATLPFVPSQKLSSCCDTLGGLADVSSASLQHQ